MEEESNTIHISNGSYRKFPCLQINTLAKEAFKKVEAARDKSLFKLAERYLEDSKVALNKYNNSLLERIICRFSKDRKYKLSWAVHFDTPAQVKKALEEGEVMPPDDYDEGSFYEYLESEYTGRLMRIDQIINFTAEFSSNEQIYLSKEDYLLLKPSSF